MLLAAQEHNCVRAIALIAAVTQGRGLLRRAEGKQAREDRDDLLGSDDDSDLFVLIRAFRFAEKNNFDPKRCARLSVNASAAREAAQLWEQFVAIARDEGLDVETQEAEPGAIQRCVLAGFPDQVAVRLDQGTLRCALVHGRRGVLARESVVHRAPLLVASEIREIESSDKERQVLLTLATRIEESWLRDLFPEAFSEAVEVTFDATSRRVVAHAKITFHDLVLRNGPADVPPGRAAALLAEQVIAGTCPLKNWDNAVEQWIARVNCAASWFPELQIPPIGEEDKLLLIEQICSGAVSYKEIKDRQVWPTVKSWLPPHQQAAIEQARSRTHRAAERAQSEDRVRCLWFTERRGTHPGSLRRGAQPYARTRARAARDPGARAKPPPDPDHERSGRLLARRLSEVQKRAATQVSEARVALTPGRGAARFPLCEWVWASQLSREQRTHRRAAYCDASKRGRCLRSALCGR
jgi:HrpA-like RNA helicase